MRQRSIRVARSARLGGPCALPRVPAEARPCHKKRVVSSFVVCFLFLGGRGGGVVLFPLFFSRGGGGSGEVFFLFSFFFSFSFFSSFFLGGEGVMGTSQNGPPFGWQRETSFS